MKNYNDIEKKDFLKAMKDAQLEKLFIDTLDRRFKRHKTFTINQAVNVIEKAKSVDIKPYLQIYLNGN